MFIGFFILWIVRLSIWVGVFWVFLVIVFIFICLVFFTILIEFVFQAFNTFIDDVFAFIITMPTAHRLACFRDDVVFIIYLYQRW